VTIIKLPVVAVVGCVDTVLTVDSVGVVNGVVVTVLSVVTGAVVTVVVKGTVGVVSDSVVTVVGVVVDSVIQNHIESCNLLCAREHCESQKILRYTY